VKKTCIRLLAFALLLLCLCGCSAGQESEAPVYLWFIERSEDGASSLATENYGGETSVSQLVAALLNGPSANSGLRSPIPAGTRLQSLRWEEDVVCLDLSLEYRDLVGVDQVLADYCITLTLTQLEGVEGVRITVDGRGLPNRERQVLRRSDVVLSGAEEEPVERTVSLCFRREGGNELGVELRVFRLTENQSATMAVLQALLAGPGEPGLLPLLPQEAEVYSARVEAGVCYADFSAGLLSAVPGTLEEQQLVVSSIVESLCSLGYVQSVQLMVEGEPLTMYGQVDVSQPLN